MSVNSNENNVLEQLKTALSAGELNKKASQRGSQLLQRLCSPVRVVVFGLSGCGKSQLINLLVGERIIPDGMLLPTLELSWAQTPRTIVTHEDQSVEEFDGLNLQNIDENGAASIRLETNRPILKKISLLEVSVEGTLDQQVETLEWAVSRADIALWCSQGFSAQESALWAQVPETLKDHSFFVLTKADELSAQRVLSTRILELQGVVDDEFHSMVPVATLQGLAAFEGEGAVDKSALKASGGGALIASILRQVEQGRKADLDSALLFLSRYTANVGGNADSSPEKPSETSAIVELSATGDQSNIDHHDAPYSKALEYLNERSTLLTNIVQDNAEDNIPSILEHCTSTADNIVEILSRGNPADNELLEAQDDAMEVADVILLMQLEEGEGPAADAITLLLQIQRDLAVKIAA